MNTLLKKEYKKTILTSLLTAFIYMIILVLISFILAFPGIGVLILPQPFIKVVFGRWVAAYYPFNFNGIIWALYIITLHLVYYLSITKFTKLSNFKTVIGGVLFGIINIVLVLAKFTPSMFFWAVVSNYALAPCNWQELFTLLIITSCFYWTLSIFASICVETFSYKIAVRITKFKFNYRLKT